MVAFRCDDCGTVRTGRPSALWRCGCGGPVSLVGHQGLNPAALSSRAPTLWRYRDAMAIPPGVEPVTLGEGMTPLVLRDVAGLGAHFKLEMLNPTGSFKDRGAAVVASVLRWRGITAAVEDSSGNAGAAMAAYGSRAGIDMQVVAPEGAPLPKLAAIRGSGGRLVLVPGGRDAAAREALRRASAGTAFASHVWDPHFLEGTRTLAFEIWEQTGGLLPARLFLPVGNGSLLLGAASGFSDLVAWKLAARTPALMGVQALFCAPMVQGAPPPDPARGTAADGIRIPVPPRAKRMREVVASSGGRFLSVREEQILGARTALGQAGLDVEPTAAAAFAGALAWREASPASVEGPPVVVLTGSGLKVPLPAGSGPAPRTRTQGPG